MTTSQTDRIEKKLVLKASLARVWRAISTAKEFGAWFGARFPAEFAEGVAARGTIAFKGKELSIMLAIERIQPQSYFSFRWHPYAIDPNVDYSSEEKTLVEFQLVEVPGGTELTITESGFDRVPAARRAEAFRMNDGGWAAQIKNIEGYVAA